MNKTQVSKLNALFLATCPIWAVYEIIPGNSLSRLFILLLVVLNLFAQSPVNYKRSSEKFLFWGVLTASIIGIILNINYSYFNSSIVVGNLYSIVCFFLALFFCTKNINIDTFIRSVMLFAIAGSIIVIFQKTQYIATGSYSNIFFIPGLKTYRELDTFSLSRPSAFMQEPAHLSIYLLPALYLFINEKKYLKGLLVFLGILSSGSSTGFLLSGVLLVVHVVVNEKKNSKKILNIISLSLLLLAVYSYAPYLFESNMDRLSNTEGDSSFELRLLGPLMYLGNFNTTQWLFGIGYNQLEGFSIANNSFLYDAYGQELIKNYANAFLFMLLSFGIVGEVILILYTYKIYKEYQPNIGLFIILIAILLSDQVLFNENLLYLIGFIIVSQSLFQNNNESSIYN